MTAREAEHVPAPSPPPASGTRSERPPGRAPAGRTVRATARACSRTYSRTCKAHIETWRPYTLAYPGLVGLAGAALGSADAASDGSAGAGLLVVAWAAPTLGWVSGHYVGDWFDRGLDAISKPQRPLPSKRLSPREALVCGIGCAVAAAVAAASVNWRTVVLFAVAMLGIVAYSRLLKGRGLTGNAVRGALTATTVTFGAMTVTELPSWQVLLFAAVFCAQDTASNLVGTLRDVEGDRRGGCRTVPVRHGVRTAVRTATALHAAALVIAVPALLLVTGGRGSSAPVLLLCAAGCGTAAFLPLLREVAGVGDGPGVGAGGAGSAESAESAESAGRRSDVGDGGGRSGIRGAGTAVLDPRRALRAHEVLVAERMLLAGALLAAGWGALPALAVVVPLLALSLLAQSRMRSRHEFPGPDTDGETDGDSDGDTATGTGTDTYTRTHAGTRADTDVVRDGAPRARHAAAHDHLRGDVTSC